MQPPKPLKKGPPWLRKWLNSLALYAEQNHIVQGPAYLTHETASGTMLVFNPAKGGGGLFPTFPFQVLPGSGTDGISLKVALNSFLLKNINPTTKITITGLNESFNVESGDHIWLRVDISATYSTTPGPITAAIEHGAQWPNSGTTGFFPLPVRYNTDNGTRLGSSGTPPDNAHVTDLFVPIAYVESKTRDSFGLIAQGYGMGVGEDLFVIQQCFNHLVLGTACIDGGQVTYPVPAPFSPQPS